MDNTAGPAWHVAADEIQTFLDTQSPCYPSETIGDRIRRVAVDSLRSPAWRHASLRSESAKILAAVHDTVGMLEMEATSEGPESGMNELFRPLLLKLVAAKEVAQPSDRWQAINQLLDALIRQVAADSLVQEASESHGILESIMSCFGRILSKISMRKTPQDDLDLTLSSDKLKVLRKCRVLRENSSYGQMPQRGSSSDDAIGAWEELNSALEILKETCRIYDGDPAGEFRCPGIPQEVIDRFRGRISELSLKQPNESRRKTSCAAGGKGAGVSGALPSVEKVLKIRSLLSEMNNYMQGSAMAVRTAKGMLCVHPALLPFERDPKKIFRQIRFGGPVREGLRAAETFLWHSGDLAPMMSWKLDALLFLRLLARWTSKEEPSLLASFPNEEDVAGLEQALEKAKTDKSSQLLKDISDRQEEIICLLQLAIAEIHAQWCLTVDPDKVPSEMRQSVADFRRVFDSELTSTAPPLQTPSKEKKEYLETMLNCILRVVTVLEAPCLDNSRAESDATGASSPDDSGSDSSSLEEENSPAKQQNTTSSVPSAAASPVFDSRSDQNRPSPRIQQSTASSAEEGIRQRLSADSVPPSRKVKGVFPPRDLQDAASETEEDRQGPAAFGPEGKPAYPGKKMKQKERPAAPPPPPEKLMTAPREKSVAAWQEKYRVPRCRNLSPLEARRIVNRMGKCVRHTGHDQFTINGMPYSLPRHKTLSLKVAKELIEKAFGGSSADADGQGPS